MRTKIKPQFTENTIYIIGGGPAGLAAAIAAHDAIENVSPQKNIYSPNIVILEKSDKIGQTILHTGNGRCNFSNLNIENGKGYKKYNHPQFVEQVLRGGGCVQKVNTTNQAQALQTTNVQQVSQFFDKLGLGCQVKNSGMMFPYTNKASSVLDVLRFGIEERNIKVITGVDDQQLARIIKKAKALNNSRETNNHNFKFIVATGGNDKTTQKLLLKSIETTPCKKVLGPIKVDKPNIKNIDGIRANVALNVTDKGNKVFCETGEILFRKYGVSGIVAFNASRFLGDYDSKTQDLQQKKEANKQQSKQKDLCIDFFPEISREDLITEIEKRIVRTISNTKHNKNHVIQLTRIVSGLLLPQVTNTVLQNANIKNELSNDDTKRSQQIKKATLAFKNFVLKNAQIADAKQCQVSRGGIKVTEIDPTTMSIKKLNNVYIAGECVDIDGPCGGYNLHWAWLSGIIAGTSAAKSFF